MKTEDFIYKNTALQLHSKYPKARVGLIAKCAGKAKKHYLSSGNFKGKAFDVCYKVAEDELKTLIKAKV